MCSEEEVIEVAENREDEVEKTVEEGVVCYCDSSFPDLISPVDVDNTGINKMKLEGE
jgi:hypothetical protein